MDDFEQQLRGMVPRTPPRELRAAVLAPAVGGAAPWFPKPLLAGLAGCWLGTAALVLTTPKDDPPPRPGPCPGPSGDEWVPAWPRPGLPGPEDGFTLGLLDREGGWR